MNVEHSGGTEETKRACLMPVARRRAQNDEVAQMVVILGLLKSCEEGDPLAALYDMGYQDILLARPELFWRVVDKYMMQQCPKECPERCPERKTRACDTVGDCSKPSLSLWWTYSQIWRLISPYPDHDIKPADLQLWLKRFRSLVGKHHDHFSHREGVNSLDTLLNSIYQFLICVTQRKIDSLNLWTDCPSLENGDQSGDFQVFWTTVATLKSNGKMDWGKKTYPKLELQVLRVIAEQGNTAEQDNTEEGGAMPND